jgi:hypothetical protein
MRPGANGVSRDNKNQEFVCTVNLPLPLFAALNRAELNNRRMRLNER